MSKLCIDLPPIAPDYSGAASALFDLGGIVVMHDASGCTGNYTGFDEPRWMGSKSAVYCSGLRRMDAIMGNDQKFIDGALAAAKDLNPTLIAYLGSPVPMVIGIDMEGMAAETEDASGIPSFGINTTGQHYYDKGASDTFLKLIKRFTKKPVKVVTNSAEPSVVSLPDGHAAENKKRANVLGLLSIDMGNEKNPDEICKKIEAAGFEIQARFAMGLSIEQIEHAADADLNIVTAKCGLDAAQYMEKRYGIPYICGAPVGDGNIFERKLQKAMEMLETGEGNGEKKTVSDHLAAASGKTEGSDSDFAKSADRGILIIHEQIFANSIREEIEELCDIPVTVGSMYKLDSRLAREGDIDLPHELSVRKAINSGEYAVILADPVIRKLIRREDITFIDMPHVALSGRLHLDRYPSYLGEDMKNRIQEAISCMTK